MYRCPVCGHGLEKFERTLKCDHNHSYDVAREGYVNLLLANQKNSKEPGDSKAMIEYRQYFLNQGYYDVLSDALNLLVAEREISQVLDLGCGEGFYSDRLRKFLGEGRAELWGIDISKPAIQKAAKRNSEIAWCVGSSFQLPYLDGSFDTIFSIFAPFDPKEVRRVLKPGGRVIVVRPGPNHLKELVSLLYEKFEPQGDSSQLSENLGLKQVNTLSVQTQIHLKNPKEIESLVGMTPYAWSLHEDQKKLLAATQELTTSVDFQVVVFES